MRDLLFLAHRIPYPPNKGDKIRSWNILSHLASRFRVHLGCFIDDPDDWRYEQQVRDVCASVSILDLDPTRAKLRSLRCLATGQALSIGYYRDRRMREWVSQSVSEHKISDAFVFSSSMAQFALPHRAVLDRCVIDFVDIDSDKWRQYAERKSFPQNMIYRREHRTLLAAERAYAKEADASLFVSDQEAADFRALAPESADRIHALVNGIDTELFDPAAPTENPFSATENAIVFTGAMDYWANVDAVCWFAEEILPRVREQIADAVFWIVGANPAPEVRKLEERAGVKVTGRVEDVRGYVAHANVIVAPLRIARGIQNKVLEAMAMARPIVATPEAVEGIHAQRGDELECRENPENFANAVVNLLTGDGGSEMGRKARDRVLSDHGWRPALAGLDRLLTAEIQ